MPQSVNSNLRDKTVFSITTNIDRGVNHLSGVFNYSKTIKIKNNEPGRLPPD